MTMEKETEMSKSNLEKEIEANKTNSETENEKTPNGTDLGKALNVKRSSMHHAKKWKRKFLYDFTKKEFIPIKGLFFLIYGANAALVPFLTLQARSLGVTEGEVGTIYSFLPLSSLFAPTLAGMLADRIGNFRVFLSISTALAGLTGVLFLAVPVGRIHHALPEHLSFEVNCSPQFGHNMEMMNSHHCDIKKNVDSFSVDVMNCSSNCFETQDFAMKNFSNLMCGNSSDCFHNSAYEYDLVNKTHSESAVQIFNLNSSNSFQSYDDDSESNFTIRFTRESDNKISYDSDERMCPNFSEEHLLEDGAANNAKSKRNCFTKCVVVTTRKHLCSNAEYVEDINSSLTFYSHLLVRLLKEFTLAICLPLLEGASIMILREHNGDFGFNRLYYNLGMMVMTPISGALIDYVSKGTGREDFSPAMYLYCALNLFAAVVILFLNLEFKKGSKKVMNDFTSMLLNPEVIFFLLAAFLAGTLFGYIETFIFWLLEDLGADKTLMGLTITVGSVFGVPLLLVSTYILKQLGHVNTIVLGFIVYIVRLIGYTVIPSPWWAMPFEAMECMTVSLMLVAFASYSLELASPTTVVTLQGMYVGLYNGVGKGAGSLIGGYLIEAVGIFATFRIMAAVAGVSGVMYLMANLVIAHCRRSKGNDEVVDVEMEKNEKEIVKNGL